MFPAGIIAPLSNQRIIINESALAQRNEALAKVEKLKKELKKKAKGARGAQTKLKEAREVKKEILELTRQATTGSLHKSADLSTLGRINGELKKEILTIYFYLLKTSQSAHLLQEVFIGIPKFTKLVNIELTANLLDVLR